MPNAPKSRGWLLLMHQLPSHPSQLRVKVWRRLAKIGAVALKNSVYVLPQTDASLEDLHWVRREIIDSGGEATIVEAGFVSGQSDDDVEALFRKARDAEYAEVLAEARGLGKRQPLRSGNEKTRRERDAAVKKLEQRLEEIRARDFFLATKGKEATRSVHDLRKRLDASTQKPSRPPKEYQLEELRGRTWVTRSGVKVDRIASAWLILRFIDSKAKVVFVDAKTYEPKADELRFDMFDAEFSHEGDDCTFETLCRRLKLRRPGLSAVAEIIHDIDVKDEKFNRPETAGVAMLIDGLVRKHADDRDRLARGLEIFDEVLAHFARD